MNQGAETSQRPRKMRRRERRRSEAPTAGPALSAGSLRVTYSHRDRTVSNTTSFF